MRKLIESYRLKQTPELAAKLAAYIDRHPMAVCLLDDADLLFLTTHGFL
jgi:hypothetical protein